MRLGGQQTSFCRRAQGFDPGGDIGDVAVRVRLPLIAEVGIERCQARAANGWDVSGRRPCGTGIEGVLPTKRLLVRLQELEKLRHGCDEGAGRLQCHMDLEFPCSPLSCEGA